MHVVLSLYVGNIQSQLRQRGPLGRENPLGTVSFHRFRANQLSSQYLACMLPYYYQM
jgi:hypothetical protein